MHEAIAILKRKLYAIEGEITNADVKTADLLRQIDTLAAYRLAMSEEKKNMVAAIAAIEHTGALEGLT